MHLTHIDPWRILSAAMAALIVALAAAVLLKAVGNLDFSSGGDPVPVSKPTTTTPTWVQDPISSPVAELRASTAVTP
jgi:hypothetical protein